MSSNYTTLLEVLEYDLTKKLVKSNYATLQHALSFLVFSFKSLIMQFDLAVADKKSDLHQLIS